GACILHAFFLVEQMLNLLSLWCGFQSALLVVQHVGHGQRSLATGDLPRWEPEHAFVVTPDVRGRSTLGLRLALTVPYLGPVKKYQLPFARFDGVIPVTMELVRDQVDG